MKNDPALLGTTVVHLSICYQHLANRLNQELKPVDLNMTQISILSHFSRHPDATETISGLADTMEMNQPAVTKAIKSLTGKKWITRQIDEDDARVSHLKITKLGLKQLAKAHQACGPLIEKSFTAFSTKELSQLLGLLSKLKDGLNQ